MDELRYGYTLRDVQDIALYAARTSYGRSSSLEERLRAAWSGVVEYLYAADYWPSRDKLADAGRREVTRDQRAEWHHYGKSMHRPYEYSRTMSAFQRYWCLMEKPYPAPDGAVVERLAVAQILPLMSPRERDVLLALAAYDTHQQAAAALGMNRGAFSSSLSYARRRFLALWHEGESPSRIWRIDRRVNAYGEVSNRTSAATLRSQRRGYARTRAAAKAADRAVVS